MLSTSDTFGTLPVVTGSAPTLLGKNHKVLARQFVAVLAMGFKGVAVVVSHANTREFCSEKSHSFSLTNAATPSSKRIGVRVFRIEFMSALAMSLGRILSDNTHSAPNILFLSNRLQMGWPHTGRGAA